MKAAADATRLAGEAYSTRLARDVANVQSDTGEFYKVGDKIGDRYEVSAIHHGELGVVYGCFDHQTKLPRALKTVRARHAGDKQVLSLFESEATVWISLEKHPHIVRAYLVERINRAYLGTRFNSLPYVITEYVRGPEGMEGDLRGWLGHPRLTLPVAVAMALQIAQGMQHAVSKVPNLVHRDLKPGNILVNGDGKAMVTDFGLVRAAQSGAGTPAYMSPEQWRAEALDLRSDIYAYGCILFEMFTAHRLFPAVTECDWEQAHLARPPAALASILQDLPSEIDQFVRRCLAKDLTVRPQSWDEIVAFFAAWYHRLTGKAVILDFSALAIDPNFISAWTNKGDALFRLKRYDDAIKAYDRALAIDPENIDTWERKCGMLHSHMRYEEAVEGYDRVLAIGPDNAAMWRGKGDALFRLKRYDDAIKAYDRALAIDPENIDTWERKCRTLQSHMLYEEAVKACDQMLAIGPDNAATWCRKGYAFDKLKRYDDAIKAYDRALAIDPEDVDIWRHKGDTLYRLNRGDEAIQAYDRALAIDPEDVDTWDDKGAMLSSMERDEEAIQAYDRALAIAPEYADALIYKGIALDNLQRFDEAIHAWDRALAINPSDALTWSYKGEALAKLERYEEAIQAFDRALTIEANNENSLQGRKSAADALKAAK